MFKKNKKQTETIKEPKEKKVHNGKREVYYFSLSLLFKIPSIVP